MTGIETSSLLVKEEAILARMQNYPCAFSAAVNFAVSTLTARVILPVPLHSRRRTGGPVSTFPLDANYVLALSPADWS